MPTYLGINNLVYPTQYTGDVFAHEKVNSDLKDIIHQSGERGKIQAILQRQIAFLDKHRVNAIQHSEWFEILKGYDGSYYSMRIKCQSNIRIIYTFLDAKPILLYAFSEKRRGTSKTKSYSAAYEVAKLRLLEIEHTSIRG